MSQNLRIAIQKSGRLADSSFALLEKCGINIRKNGNRQLLIQDGKFGLDMILSRDDDIPELIKNGICDIGIIGQNLLDEYCSQQGDGELKIIMPLGFSKCRLSLATPKGSVYKSINDLNDKIIATSYPNILREFLRNNNGTVENTFKIPQLNYCN